MPQKKDSLEILWEGLMFSDKNHNLVGAGVGPGEKMVLAYPSETPAKTLARNYGKKKIQKQKLLYAGTWFNWKWGV